MFGLFFKQKIVEYNARAGAAILTSWSRSRVKMEIGIPSKWDTALRHY